MTALTVLYCLCFYLVYSRHHDVMQGQTKRLVAGNLVLAVVSVLMILILWAVGSSVAQHFRLGLKCLAIALPLEFMQIIFFLFAFKMKHVETRLSNLDKSIEEIMRKIHKVQITIRFVAISYSVIVICMVTVKVVSIVTSDLMLFKVHNVLILSIYFPFSVIKICLILYFCKMGERYLLLINPQEDQTFSRRYRCVIYSVATVSILGYLSAIVVSLYPNILSKSKEQLQSDFAFLFIR